jgi:O-antigen ligase
MAAVSMMIIGLLALAIMRSPEVSTRFEASFSSGDMTGREVLFPLAVKMFDERPWLGWGLGNNEYELASRLLQPDYRLVFASRDMHNVALQILTSSGVIGFFMFAAGFSYVALEAWRARTGPEGILPFALLISTVVISMSLGWIASKMAWMLLAYPLVAGEAIRSRKRSTFIRLSA